MDINATGSGDDEDDEDIRLLESGFSDETNEIRRKRFSFYCLLVDYTEQLGKDELMMGF
jgi:hypothetical protein